MTLVLQEKADQFIDELESCCFEHSLRIFTMYDSEFPLQLNATIPSNFHSNRDYFSNNQLSLLLSLLTKAEVENIISDLDNGNIITMLSHYGNYKLLYGMYLKSKIFDNNYIECIGALQKYNIIFKHENDNDLICDSVVHQDECDYEMPLVLIDGKDRIHKDDNYYSNIFYLFIRNYVTSFTSTSNHWKSDTKCDCYSAEYGDCKMYLKRYSFTRAGLGYLMLFASDDIHIKLKSFSIKKLQKYMISHYKNIADQRNININNLFCKILKRKAKEIQNWNINDLQEIGKKYIFSEFEFMKKMMQKSFDDYHFCNVSLGNLLYFMGKIELLINRNYIESINIFVASICSKNNLYKKILSLIELSNACYLNMNYLIGMKVLKYAYKLSKGYIMASFVENEYFIKQKKFKRKIKKLKCGNIGCNQMWEYRLRSCTGCMKISFCSKYCQKTEWKRQHQVDCDNLWGNLYERLKESIFELY